ncbi:winged helix-turn-helix domain-containing protein [Micromonospora psammae]|uniref:winged helix-turn-helix domain-containing protein n=1 Tax=Micromonospora sp. CPCC 205556 TaxID=3122398 RepID=UPI003FA55B1A
MEHLSTREGGATACAEIVGLSPSATSYHLRALAKFGLVEQAPSRGGRAGAFVAHVPPELDGRRGARREAGGARGRAGAGGGALRPGHRVAGLPVVPAFVPVVARAVRRAGAARPTADAEVHDGAAPKGVPEGRAPPAHPLPDPAAPGPPRRPLRSWPLSRRPAEPGPAHGDTVRSWLSASNAPGSGTSSS